MPGYQLSYPTALEHPPTQAPPARLAAAFSAMTAACSWEQYPDGTSVCYRQHTIQGEQIVETPLHNWATSQMPPMHHQTQTVFHIPAPAHTRRSPYMQIVSSPVTTAPYRPHQRYHRQAAYCPRREASIYLAMTEPDAPDRGTCIAFQRLPEAVAPSTADTWGPSSATLGTLPRDTPLPHHQQRVSLSSASTEIPRSNAPEQHLHPHFTPSSACHLSTHSELRVFRSVRRTYRFHP